MSEQMLKERVNSTHMQKRKESQSQLIHLLLPSIHVLLHTNNAYTIFSVCETLVFQFLWILSVLRYGNVKRLEKRNIDKLKKKVSSSAHIQHLKIFSLHKKKRISCTVIKKILSYFTFQRIQFIYVCIGIDGVECQFFFLRRFVQN